MLYAYQLRAHPNVRYQQSLLSLSQKELACMLAACGIEAEVQPRILGGAPFLCFEAPALSPEQQAFLCGLSCLYMTAALEGGLLRPLDQPLRASFLPADMPEVLKYKGKTNADFTQLMINLALSAGGQWRTPKPLILDPMCGRGTTLFCALIRGMDAVGVETDKKSLHEGLTYARKWLQYHRIKHTSETGSLTLGGGRSAPSVSVRMAQDGQTLSFDMIQADTRDAGQMLKKRPAHALIADLPYGVQHAPRENGHISGFAALLSQALPAWRQALRPGCAAAIAFNTYTLKRSELEKLACQAGFVLPDPTRYSDFSHWVEQAVNRDVLVALNPAIPSTIS